MPSQEQQVIQAIAAAVDERLDKGTSDEFHLMGEGTISSSRYG